MKLRELAQLLREHARCMDDSSGRFSQLVTAARKCEEADAALTVVARDQVIVGAVEREIRALIGES